MRLLIDSSVWIDHLRGRRTRETLLLHDWLEPDPLLAVADTVVRPQILMGDLILCEVLRGIDDDAQATRVRRILLAFTQVRLGGIEVALAAAEHYRALRRLGITVRKAIDCLIAAWCIGDGATLLHADRDFHPFAVHRGLRVA